MNFSKCILGKNILGQPKGGMKILFITVLIYAEENCKSSTHKKITTGSELMYGLLQYLQTLKVWKA